MTLPYIKRAIFLKLIIPKDIPAESTVARKPNLTFENLT
jgi:hypothetical protein